MKLDYSAKDKNWHIYTPDSTDPICPRKEAISWPAIGIAVGAILVAFLIFFGIYYFAERLHAAESAPPVVEAPQDTAIQTVTIPLELPKTSQS